MASVMNRIGTIESDEDVEICEDSDDGMKEEIFSPFTSNYFSPLPRCPTEGAVLGNPGGNRASVSPWSRYLIEGAFNRKLIQPAMQYQLRHASGSTVLHVLPDNPPVTSKKKKKLKLKNTGMFCDDFLFESDSLHDDNHWKIDKHVQKSARGQKSTFSLEDRIEMKRNNKQVVEAESETVHGKDESIQSQSNDLEYLLAARENEQTSSEDECSSDDPDKIMDESNFFEHPEPQVLQANFSKLNLSRPLLRAVNELGFQRPTPIQCSTIPVALLGKDICACAATGTGKTASYILPILERLLFRPKQVPTSRVLILLPTRELAVQVYTVCKSIAKYLDVQICLASGGMKMKDQEAELRRNPDIIVATPGRLVDHLQNTPSFGLQNIEILVVDEADRMLEEHFEDQMKEIIKQCQKGRQTMLFSATMTDQVEELVSLSLNRPVRVFVDQNTDVASCLQQEFVRIRPTREGDRLAIATALCCRTFNEHCLVFCQTKKLAHNLRIILGMFGLKVGELHGDLNQLQRLEALENFKDSKVDVLVATDLAARGLDIPGVKTVISFNMPTSFKSYIHRVGRTARAGKFGRSITLVGEKERKNLKFAIKNSAVAVKHRIIPPDIIESFKKKIQDVQKDVADILKDEAEEKELRMSEMEANKAKNMIIHHEEIMSRPPKSWIKRGEFISCSIISFIKTEG
eukprot:gene1939-16447_t